MTKFKIGGGKVVFNRVSLAFLVVFALFSFGDAWAGKFEEIPCYNAYGQKVPNAVILQFDDDEGRRGYGFTIEIGKVESVLEELSALFEISSKKGQQIMGVDFSYSDLGNEKFWRIASYLEKLNVRFNLDETDVDLIYDKTESNSLSKTGCKFITITLMDGTTAWLFDNKKNLIKEKKTGIEDNVEKKQKLEAQQKYKFEKLRSIKISQDQWKHLEQDLSEDDDE